MTRIIVLFNLKSGVDAADYEAWAKSVDLPVVNRLGSIERFEIFKSGGLLGSAASAPFAYIETIDVRDMDAFGRDVASAEMQRVAAKFAAFADATFIVTQRLGADEEQSA